MQSHQLTHDAVFPVCSPGLAKAPPRLRRPSDLRHRFLLTTIGFAEGWRHWFAAAGIDPEPSVTGHAKLPICGQLNFPTLPGGRRAEHVGRGEAEGDDSATDPERVGGGYGRAGAMGAGSSDVLRGAGDDR